MSEQERERRRDAIAEQRRRLPDAPGVYVFHDADDRVVYVGKSKSIRKRVASHFSSRSTLGRLADEVERIDFLVTDTEAEALIAEQQFIKRHRPVLNVKLRDDKSYPYIGISLDEEFPRVYFTRERHRPSRAYFGPYANARRVRETLELLGKLFQYRTCVGAEPGRRSGVPCLDYYIKRCGAPCVGYVDAEEYRRNIDAIRRFLSGRYRDVERDLEGKMDEAAEAQEFERAALFRDRLAAVRSLMERQRVAGEGVGTADLIGVAVEGTDANAQVFQVRDGVLAERQGFYLDNQGERDITEVAEQFVAQYYEASPAVPPLVVVGPELSGSTELLAEAIGERRGTAVEVRAAERGDKRRLRELAQRNAQLALAQEGLRRERQRRQRTAALDELAAALGLDEVPIRIEGYDISNLGAENTVASMVVFEGGAPKKSDYRRFNIRGRSKESGPDDFASMEEVLRRRLDRYMSESERSPHDAELDESFASLPGLIMIDGGKGQLGAGAKALAPLIERGTTVVSLAKRLEEVYVPGRSDPLPIPADSEASRLLQRVRDEAHRFALDLHRRRRGKSMTGSVLDGLRGVGPARKRALLNHFGSPERFVNASREELEAVPGIPGKLARDIHRQLNKTGASPTGERAGGGARS
ncbi:MAG: excinuclease ABC subunit UvrC [Solirubrobacterales bacterium]|nr:excinuclease ABC subunit UvrC [Solirubrobacterales bacterium]MCB8970672.1 excinuclease ABC subunit UvrC [Thermoleophilales bacterium]MCO5326462.1 excinuclease ABC subunit UvrC [Solirubrobacterales bacterium]